MNVFNPRPTTQSSQSERRLKEQDSFRRALAQQSIGMLAAGGYFSLALAKQVLTAGQTDSATAPATRRAAPMLVGRHKADACQNTVCCA